MPNVYDDQKTDSLEDLERSFAAPSATESGSDIAAKNKEAAGLEAAYAAPSATESGSKKLEDAKSLTNKEETATDKVGALGYTGPAKPGPKKRSGTIRRRTYITGIIVGLVTGTLTVGSFLSGPLEFLHIAESIRAPHFSATSNFTDSRLGKYFVYSRTNSVGDTRLDWVQRSYKGKILAEMDKLGIKPVTDTRLNQGTGLDYLKSWQLDTNVTGSPIEGMNPDQVTEWAKTNLGIDAKNVLVRNNGKVYIKTSNFVTQTKATYNLNRELGKSRLSSAMRTRTLGRFFDITFHPIKILDQKLNTKVAQLYKNWKDNRAKSIKDGASAVKVEASTTSTDANGNKTTTATSTDTATPTGVKGALTDFLSSPAGKVTSGALLGAGFVCVARQTADSIGDFKYAQVIVPLIRTGMELISLGDQVASGKDVDTTQLDFYAQQLVTRDSSGKIINSWSDSASIEANNGGSGGVAVPATVSQSVKPGIPTDLQWTQSSAVTAMCSGVGQAIQLGAGVVSIAFGGGILTDIAKVLVAGVLTSKGVAFASNALSGEAVKLATGADLGSQADYGAALASNMTSMQFGGNALSTTQAYELNQQTVAYEQSQFQSKNLVARLFDVKDRHSFASQIIDSNVFDARNDIASIQESLLNPLRTFGSLFSNIFSSTRAFAATPAYGYGFPTLGFSLEDQNNPLIAVPQENAAVVSKLLDSNSPSAQEYIQRAYGCYGVQITNGPQGWDVIPASTDAFKNTYAINGSQDAVCSTPASQDPDWLRIRAFIADTATIEGWSCTEGDETACSNDGFGNSTSSTTTSTTIPTGTAKELAQQIISSPNISFQTAQEKTDFQQIVDTGQQTGCGGTVISPRLLGTVLALSQKYALVLGVVDNGHSCNSGNHPKGKAVDINGIRPLSGSLPATGNSINPTADHKAFISSIQPTIRQFYTDAIQLLSSGGGGEMGQLQCFTSVTAPLVNPAPGVTIFNDSCDHVHMDVGT